MRRIGRSFSTAAVSYRPVTREGEGSNTIVSVGQIEHADGFAGDERPGPDSAEDSGSFLSSSTAFVRVEVGRRGQRQQG